VNDNQAFEYADQARALEAKGDYEQALRLYALAIAAYQADPTASDYAEHWDSYWQGSAATLMNICQLN
jgi:hypothetical protein